MSLPWRCGALAALLTAFAAPTASAQDLERFYAGRKVSVVIGHEVASGCLLFLYMASLCSLYLALALAMLPWRRVVLSAHIEDAQQTPERQTSP